MKSGGAPREMPENTMYSTIYAAHLPRHPATPARASRAPRREALVAARSAGQADSVGKGAGHGLRDQERQGANTVGLVLRSRFEDLFSKSGREL